MFIVVQLLLVNHVLIPLMGVISTLLIARHVCIVEALLMVQVALFLLTRIIHMVNLNLERRVVVGIVAHLVMDLALNPLQEHTSISR